METSESFTSIAGVSDFCAGSLLIVVTRPPAPQGRRTCRP